MLDLAFVRERAKLANPDPVWTGDVLIVDGKNLIHRLASNETNSESLAVVVVEKLAFLLEWYKPERLIVGWEGDGTNWRLAYLPEYKGHRNRESEIHDRVAGAVDMLPSLLAETVFDQVTTTNAEGDDVFATLAQRFADQGLTVAIYSNDGDLWQLVTDKVTIIRPQRGDLHDLAVTLDYVRSVGPEYVRKHLGHGIEPPKIADLKGLMGDAGDNIPGVKGIGPKVALELVTKHGSFEAVMRAAAAIDIEPRPAEDPESKIKSKRLAEPKAVHAARVREEFGATLAKLSKILDQESIARASFEAGKIKNNVEIIDIESRVTLPAMLHARLQQLGASDWLLSRVDKIVRSK